MSNKLYPNGKALFLKGRIDWASDTLKVALLSSAYTYDPNHVYYSEVTGVIGVPATIASATVTPNATNAVADGANTPFAAIVAGSTVTQYVIYKDTGTDTNSPLIAHFDSGSGLPFATNGGVITITWPTAGIFEF